MAVFKTSHLLLRQTVFAINPGRALCIYNVSLTSEFLDVRSPHQESPQRGEGKEGEEGKRKEKRPRMDSNTDLMRIFQNS